MIREAAGIALVRMQGKWVLKARWPGMDGHTIRDSDFRRLARFFNDGPESLFEEIER